MASLPSPRISFPSSSSHSDPNPKVFPSRTPRFLSNPSRPSLRRYKRAPPRRSRGSDRLLCLCRNTNSSDDDSGRRRWDFLLGDVVQGAVKKWGDYVSAYWSSPRKNVPVPVAVDNEEEEEEQEEAVCEMEEVEMKEGVLEEVEGNWSWDRWKRHFGEIEESERLVYALKSQLRAAVAREDYDDAEELKLAIVTAEKYDAVGKAISDMNRAVDEERYSDAASIRDSAGAGLIRSSSTHDLERSKSSLESLFCYDKSVPEENIEEPIGLSLDKKEIGNKPPCVDCQAKGAVLCTTCSGSGLYIDSILESQGVIVKVRCLGCGGTGNIMCSGCGGRGHTEI